MNTIEKKEIPNLLKSPDPLVSHLKMVPSFSLNNEKIQTLRETSYLQNYIKNVIFDSFKACVFRV